MPLPGGQLPAAHGPAGHRKDAPGPDHCCELREQGEAVQDLESCHLTLRHLYVAPRGPQLQAAGGLEREHGSPGVPA